MDGDGVNQTWKVHRDRHANRVAVFLGIVLLSGFHDTLFDSRKNLNAACILDMLSIRKLEPPQENTANIGIWLLEKIIYPLKSALK